MFIEQRLKSDLHFFQLITATLIILGLIFIYSASYFYALERLNEPLFYLKKHIVGLAIGCFAYFMAKKIPVNFFKETSFFLLIGAAIATAITMTPLGYAVHGSYRWIKLPGLLFQPSELLKIAVVLQMASLLARKKLTSKNLKLLIPTLLLLTFVSIMLLKQPDFGCMVTILSTTTLMLFVANLPFEYFAGSIGVAIPAFFILIYSQPYRWKRILAYLNPWDDPQGRGYQIIQAMIAEGSGGTWGTGIAQSNQKFSYLPMQHTDFIFAIIAEETGFIGSLFLIILCIAFLAFGFKIAWNLRDNFSKFLVQGIIILISIQFIINFFVATGLAPTKGIGLPFISYGNTALICNILMISLITNAVETDI